MSKLSTVAASAILPLMVAFAPAANAQEIPSLLEMNIERVQNTEKLAVCVTDQLNDYLKTLPSPKTQTLEQLKSQFKKIDSIEDEALIECASQAAGLTAETVSKLEALKTDKNSAEFNRLMDQHFEKSIFGIEVTERVDPKLNSLTSEMLDKQIDRASRVPPEPSHLHN
ncbi:MAG: hypothetical protein MRY79_04160 [Alphaproteobacteria bacterium]|nr:hypothetical protein [Alphaproteobacteria bacterium]